MPAYFCRNQNSCMALLLHIDTALEKAFVGLSRDGVFLAGFENIAQADHAAFVQPAIRQLFRDEGCKITDIDAVGVTSGPGSYTGLRVGMSSAKGICYALRKPLITIATLEVMTAAAIEAYPGFDRYCPLIDARRQEVFTALYNSAGKEILAPHAALLSNGFLLQELTGKKILFFGNGAQKAKEGYFFNANASFRDTGYQQTQLSRLLFNSFKNKEFRDLAYTEPLYLKSFHFQQPKPAL